MIEKDDNNTYLPNNIIASIARLLLPEIQEYFGDIMNDKDNIVQANLEDKNEVKPTA